MTTALCSLTYLSVSGAKLEKSSVPPRGKRFTLKNEPKKA